MNPEEVHLAKEAYAAQFDYDLGRMFVDLKKHEKQNPGFLVKAPHSNSHLREAPPDSSTISGS